MLVAGARIWFTADGRPGYSLGERSPVSQIDVNTLQVVTAQWLLPMDGPPIEQAFMAIADGKILAVGSLTDLPSHWKAAKPVPGTLLTPGLVNAHVHLEQSFPEPIPKGSDEPFCDWLLRVVARIQKDCSPEALFERSLLGAREVLSTGTTCVNDIACGTESLQALAKVGLRGVVSLEAFHPVAGPVTIAHWVEKYQALQRAAEAHTLLKAGLSPHSPYNVSPAAWQALLDACRPPLVHTHLAEFEDEASYLQGKSSCVQTLHQRILGREFQPQESAPSPVAYLQRFGLLNAQNVQMVAAHAIHTSAQDRQWLVEAGASVAHCPRSNRALHGQTLLAADWQGVNVPIALGTDGRLSTINLDLREEARCAMQLHGWTAGEALRAMTVQGARALGLAEEIGTLTPGKAADYVLWQASDGVTAEPEALVLHPETHVREVAIQGQTRWSLAAVGGEAR